MATAGMDLVHPRVSRLKLTVPQIQQEWANRIQKKTYKPIKRRIALRLRLRLQLGREPAAEEFEAAAKLSPIQLLVPDVTTKDIIDAYTRGEEVSGPSFRSISRSTRRSCGARPPQSMCVWRMQCVGFDNEFLQEIVEVHAKYNDKKPVI